MTLVYLTVAWVTGILLAKVLALPWQVLPALALAAAAALVLARRKGYQHRDVRLAAACTLALTLGAGRLLMAVPRFDERSLATYNDTGEVAVEGVVTGEPDERATYTNLQIRAERLWLADGVEREVRGIALVSVPPYPRLQYGDRLRLEGALRTPPVLDTFSYREYLAYRGIYSLMRHPQVSRLAENQASPVMHAILSFKQSARAAIAAMLPEPQAALLTGILLGVDSGIPADLTEAFSRSGTSHIIAISGFNMTLVSALLIRLAQRLLDRRKAHWVAIVGIAAYTVLVGASPAVVRAAAMSLLCLWGRLLGRRSHGPTSLAAAALAMTVSNPYLLWDVSFQLSFAATAGLALFGKPFEQGFARMLSRLTSAPRARAIGGILNEPLIIGFAAQLLTMPIIAAHFGQLSVVAFLANLLVLPAQPAVMVTGGIATLLGMAIHPVGQLVGWVAWAFLTYTIEAVQLMARIPYASVSVHVNGWALLAYYAACGGLAWVLARRPEAHRRLWGDLQTWVGRVGRGWVTQPMLAVAAVVLLVMGLAAWQTLPDGLLHVTVLDIGQGDAIFIRTPTGSQVLIDGGPDASLVLSQLGRRIPFWDRAIDGIILTHPDLDHLTGLLGVLERYQVQTIIYRHFPSDSSAYARWQELLQAEGATVHQAEAGQHVVLDRGLELSVLHPGPELPAGQVATTNNASVVMRLTYGSVSILLPGDIEAVVEQQLLQEGAPLASTALKVAHHGSCSSTSEEFLRAVDPTLAVISVGGNDFGHPCEEVLARLGDIPVYRTDDHGAVELISDGTQVWVDPKR